MHSWQKNEWLADADQLKLTPTLRKDKITLQNLLIGLICMLRRKLSVNTTLG